MISEHSLNGSLIVDVLFRPWSNKYLVYLWLQSILFYYYIFIFIVKLFTVRPRSSWLTAFRRIVQKIEYKVKHKAVADFRWCKSDSPNIFFKNWLTSESLLLVEAQRFHFPPPALKTGRRTWLVHLACKPRSPAHISISSITHRQQSHCGNWRSQRPQSASYCFRKYTRPTILRPLTELPQSAGRFLLHQYLLWRLSTFVLNANPASSQKNKNAPIFYLFTAKPKFHKCFHFFQGTTDAGIYRVIRKDCRGLNNCHLVLQMQPHVISFYGVTSRIRFMLLLFPQVSRNWRY